MVRGLTTYVSQRSDIFLKDYELTHNSFLVIDGDSVAVNIYIQLENKNTCFGGDYDKYANAIRVFFKKLLDCKVTPYVLFDGATQPGKGKTASKRLKDRIQKTIQINCSNEDEIGLLPLFLTEVFKSIVRELHIAMVICDFDCDKEVANIAYQLNCPLLSYDSDYYIYDVKYIPFILDENEQNLYVFRRVVKNREINQEYTIKNLRCKIFDRKTFLKRTRLTIEKLPILTVYLGNDFIDRVQNVSQFCRFLNLKHGNFVDNIINWLADKSLSQAMNKMLDYYENKSKKQVIKFAIDETIKEYICTESQYLKYLQPASTFTNIYDEYLKAISKIFIDKYRRGFYNHHFLDILLFHKYNPKPLVENISKAHSHTCSFPIINAVHKILTDNSRQDLIFYGRVGSDVYKQIIPKYEDILPSYDQVQEMNLEDKLSEFLRILAIEKRFKKDCLDLFPDSWHIFLIALKYMSKTVKIKSSFIYALVMSKIILTCVDRKLGFIRSWRDFDKFASKCGITEKKSKLTELIDVSQALGEIDTTDSLKVLEKMLHNFEMSSEMKNNDLFNRNLVHLMSEFQSCIFHVDFLNDMFDMPFEKCQIWELYNGTFIYNLICQLNSDSNFIENSLEESPSVLRSFKFIINQLQTYIA